MALISNLFKSYCYGIGNLYDEYIESLYITMKLLSRPYYRCCHTCTTAYCHNCANVILSTLSSLTDKIVCQPSVSTYLTVY